jgi:hypothetical protein
MNFALRLMLRLSEFWRVPLSSVSKGIRRCLAHRFPYAILFRVISEETLRVLITRHHRRHPSFGLRRR